MRTMNPQLPAAVVFIFALGLLGLALGQAQTIMPDYGKILGTWSLEVNAGNEYYYLILELKLADGKLGGGLSEQNGMFKDSPLLEATFDGQILKFGVKVPTPPDGAERLVKADMKLIDNKLEGTINIQDLEMTAPVTGIKK